jgi:hypothetical protein
MEMTTGSRHPQRKGEALKKLTYDSTECPHCHANLIGQPIPEKSQLLFGGATHFRRVIGIEKRDDDYISAYCCPDCGAEGSRF